MYNTLLYFPSGSEHALISGTTATICLLRQNHELVIGHVGDSVAILCRDGKAIRLTKDHHLENMEEEERVKSMGGTITSNGQGKPRVNGRLDMTRSIGDLDLKPYGVIAEPSTMFIKVFIRQMAQHSCLQKPQQWNFELKLYNA